MNYGCLGRHFFDWFVGRTPFNKHCQHLNAQRVKDKSVHTSNHRGKVMRFFQGADQGVMPEGFHFLGSGFRFRNLVMALCALLTMISGSDVLGQETADYFRKNCISCHTIGGGRLVGPDLKDVTVRKDDEWLIRFIRDPKGMIDSGDAYAQQIFAEANNVYMTQIVGMSADQAGYLLELIKAESALDESQFKGLQVDDRPFDDADRKLGEEIFLGRRPLTAGGPACIGCHTMRDLGGLGGGRLGPDLTGVFRRIGGRTPLTAWLYAPATPTMTSVFGNHPLEEDERRGLVAHFELASKDNAGEDDSTARLNFFLIGLGGSVLALALFDGFWKKRFLGVRRQMVSDRNARIMS